jgi:2-(1,2-epoxy-1,2-dihydrophenyl)acetyl-CoA isomerase
MLHILTEKRGNAMIVTFNRPDRDNAFGLDMAAQLFNALKLMTTDRAIRAVLLQGSGSHFMNGIDMALYGGDLNTALEHATEMMQPYNSAIRELLAMEKPVIASCAGMTAGPGMSFLLACDLAIAAKSAKFNCQFTSNGLTPDGGASALLARKAGLMRANELLMLSEDFSADDAARWNLVNRVVDDGKLKDEALTLLDRLADGPTRAYGGVKKLLAKSYEQDLNTQLAFEHTCWGASVRSFDFREAVKAHFAKRPAKFTGS